MSIQAVAWAISQRVGSPTGKVLLMCLANYANERGECWPSQKTIAREAELGERATRDWLQKLEAQGFIERTRRHRADGSRTSDQVVLNLTRVLNSGDGNLTAESAARPDLPASEAKPSGTSCRTYRRDVPGIEPSPKPSIEPSSGTSVREEDGFKKLWDDWPAKERPDKVKAAKWAFDRLSTTEQSSAVAQAQQFRRLAKTRKGMALMIPYLKNREFVDIAEGPDLNADGKFIITPERPEWSAWLEYMRNEYAEKTVQRVETKKYFYADTRWPLSSFRETSKSSNS